MNCKVSKLISKFNIYIEQTLVCKYRPRPNQVYLLAAAEYPDPPNFFATAANPPKIIGRQNAAEFVKFGQPMKNFIVFVIYSLLF